MLNAISYYDLLGNNIYIKKKKKVKSAKFI